MSRESHASEKAHIVPSSETQWFNKSGLSLLCSTNALKMNGSVFDAGIDNDDNLILLRSDLHHAWDQKMFTFIPKQTNGGLRVVMHCWDKDMVAEYHNVPLQGFARSEILLARFAWTLLPRAMTQFLVAAEGPRMVWINDGHGKLVAQMKTAEQCSAIANALRPRSTSPKKRKQKGDGQQVIVAKTTKNQSMSRTWDSGLELEEEDEEGSENDFDDSSDDTQSVGCPEDYARGRKRCRTGDTWCSYSKPILGSYPIK